MRSSGPGGCAAVVLAAGLSAPSASSGQTFSAEAREMQAEAERIISPYKAVMSRAPKGVPSRATVDAPILGNGRLGAVITTEAHTWPLQFWIVKSSFCKLRHDHRKGGPRPFGGPDLGIPALKGGTWRTEQHIFPAITTGRFTKGDLTVNMRAYVAATEDILIVELTPEGGTARVGCVVWPAWSRGCPMKSGATDGMQWLQRTYVTDKKVSFPAEIETSASIAVRVIGGHELVPGKPVTIAMAMQSDSDAADPLATALEMIGGADQCRRDRLRDQGRRPVHRDTPRGWGGRANRPAQDHLL